MEFFDFMGSSNVGAQSPLNWPDELVRNFLGDIPGSVPAMAMASSGPPPDLIIEIPTIKSIFTSASGLIESPLTKHVSVGIVVTALFCGVWRLQTRKLSETPTKGLQGRSHGASSQLVMLSGDTHPFPSPRKRDARPSNGADACLEIQRWPGAARQDQLVCGDSLAKDSFSRSALEAFQKQLVDVLAKLEQARIQLNELEGDKDLLMAELEAREKLLYSLQVENKEEREKRQKAEMKMEVMEYENSQLKKMRKELTVKAGQLERLAKCVKEKEEYQEKLFSENVILPRSVAQARTTEFTDMQARLQVLEARLVGLGSQSSELQSVRSWSSVSSCGDRPECCAGSIHSLVKVRRLIKAPEWRRRSSSIIGDTTEPMLCCSPKFSSTELCHTLVDHCDASPLPRPSKEPSTAKAKQSLLVEKTPEKASGPKANLSDHSSEDGHVNRVGLFAHVKPMGKGYSSDSCVSSRSSLMTVMKPSAETTHNLEECQSPARKEKPSAGAKSPLSEAQSPNSMFLSASCGSLTDDPSPEFFQTLLTDNTSTSPTKRIGVPKILKSETSLDKILSDNIAIEGDKGRMSHMSKQVGLVVHKSALRQANKIKSLFSSRSKDFQIHYQPKVKDTGETSDGAHRKSDIKSLFSSKSKELKIQFKPKIKENERSPSKKGKEDGESESDDSWCVIVPK